MDQKKLKSKKMKKNKIQFEIFETKEDIEKLFQKIEDNENKNIITALSSIANRMNGLVLPEFYKIEKVISIKTIIRPIFYYEIKLIFFSAQTEQLDYFTYKLSEEIELLSFQEKLIEYEDKKRKEK